MTALPPLDAQRFKNPAGNRAARLESLPSDRRGSQFPRAKERTDGDNSLSHDVGEHTRLQPRPASP